MDLETENRIAAILLKEAAELRRQAERDGVHVYLQKPKARGRPNSRFLTATVRGVQQANRVVEVNEMWRVRQKEIELDDRVKGRSRHEHSSSSKHREMCCAVNDNTMASCSSSKREPGYNSGEDEGLRDDEVEEFLNSRVKRGRGAVGSRMDETGPYLPCSPEHKENPSTSSALWEDGIVLGPEKPSSLKSYESSEEELDRDRQKKARRDRSRSSDRKHSKKHRSKDKRKSSKLRRRKH